MNHRIAVIGSGIAGLSAAWFLSQKGFSVTVYEAGTKPGLAAHSLNLGGMNLGFENEVWGDVPSRMFNAPLWPSVTRLYRDAGIEFEPVDNLQTFYNDAQEVFLKVGLPYRIGDILGNTFNRSAKQIANQLKAFQEEARSALVSHNLETITFGQYLSAQSIDSESQFLNHFLFPALTSTVFTCPKESLLSYPCRIVLEALEKIVDQHSPLMRTTLGSRNAAKRLLSIVQEVQFSSPVRSVTESFDKVVVETADDTREFDHAIVATQANHASKIVEGSWPEATSLLTKFQYVDVPVVVHTDESIMPLRPKDWSTFNFRTNDLTISSSCTVWMNRFHTQWPRLNNVFHTIFPNSPIDPQSIVASARLQRPSVDQKSGVLLGELQRLQNQDRRIWFVGSYAAAGVPLLESAVQSSAKVTEDIYSSTLV